MGRAQWARSHASHLGELGPSCSSHQSCWQSPSAPRSLHACPGRRALRPTSPYLLRTLAGTAQNETASHYRRRPQDPACYLWHVSFRISLRRFEAVPPASTSNTGRLKKRKVLRTTPKRKNIAHQERIFGEANSKLRASQFESLSRPATWEKNARATPWN